MRSVLKALIIIIMVIIFAGNSAFAKDKNKSVFGIKFGQFNEGTLTIDNHEYQGTSGLCGGVFLDVPVISVMDAGITVDIVEVDLISKKEYLLDVGFAVKTRHRIIKDRLTLKPGFGTGIAILKEIGFLDDSKYLTIKLFGEVIYHLNPKNGFLGELGFMWCPWGGDGTIDITGGPFTYLRGGLVF